MKKRNTNGDWNISFSGRILFSSVLRGKDVWASRSWFKRAYILLISLLISTVTFSQNKTPPEDTIKVCWGEFAGEPYFYIDGHRPPYTIGKITKGIVFDMTNSIGKHMNRKIEWVYTNRKRLATTIKSGKCDMYVGMAKEWVPSPNDFEWTSMIYREKFRFWTFSKDKIKIWSVNDVTGEKIGAVSGYYYNEFDKATQDGILKRVDAKNTETMIKMFIAGRTTMFIGSEISTYHNLLKMDQHTTTY